MKINRINKYLLLVISLTFVGIFLWFSDSIAKYIAREEQRKMEIWAEATRLLLNDEYNDFIFRIIEENENIPVIIVDDRDNYISSRNFDTPTKNVDQFFKKEIKRLKNVNPSIEIVIDENTMQYIYYDNSVILKRLSYFTYMQMLLIALIIFFLWLIIRADKRSEQDKVWIGLSKETAHQLGTPISSLMAWIEILKAKYTEDSTIQEMGKDVRQLEVIAERFSKIGSIPELSVENIDTVTSSAVRYMQNRTSKQIEYSYENRAEITSVKMCKSLYEWVIENLCKNAIDAMDGSGTIDVELYNEDHYVIVEITDSGKGIERKKFKKIFQPGYTTKKRGWGLGLSFAARIVKEYHKGDIYVKSSDIGLGTTFIVKMPVYKQ